MLPLLVHDHMWTAEHQDQRSANIPAHTPSNVVATRNTSANLDEVSAVVDDPLRAGQDVDAEVEIEDGCQCRP